mmetsp:Transcript_98732/g.307608  ORF Transcript_98732/g.307608 Transcript_98732/m.307608 type:complete len:217 (+) Transcript_98732:2013-2663(+)
MRARTARPSTAPSAGPSASPSCSRARSSPGGTPTRIAKRTGRRRRWRRGYRWSRWPRRRKISSDRSIASAPWLIGQRGTLPFPRHATLQQPLLFSSRISNSSTRRQVLPMPRTTWPARGPVGDSWCSHFLPRATGLSRQASRRGGRDAARRAQARTPTPADQRHGLAASGCPKRSRTRLADGRCCAFQLVQSSARRNNAVKTPSVPSNLHTSGGDL